MTDLRHTAQQKAGEATEQGKQKAQDASAQIQEKAHDAAEKAEGRVRQEVNTRTTEAGEQASTVADALRRTGDTLRDEGQEAPAKFIDTAADKIEQLGGYLRDADADQLLDDVEGFARRKPWLIAGVSTALGLGAARFLKASSERRHDERSGTRSQLSADRQLPARTGALTRPTDADIDLTEPLGQRARTPGAVAPPPATGITPGTGAGGLAQSDDLGTTPRPEVHRTTQELQQRAQVLDIEGRSEMTRDQLEAAITSAEAGRGRAR